MTHNATNINSYGYNVTGSGKSGHFSEKKLKIELLLPHHIQ